MDADERELQERLRHHIGKVKWIVESIRDVRVHSAALHKLEGGQEGDTCLVCECGWVRRFDKKSTILDAEGFFMEHVPNEP